MNRKKRNRRRLLLWGLIGLLLIFGLLLRFRFYPFIQEMARTQVMNQTSNTINNAVNQQIQEGEINFDKITYLEKNVQGQITAVKTDMGEVNRLKSQTLENIGREIMEIDIEDLGIPLGSVVLPAFFSGRGPRIPVKILSLSTSDADFYSEFTQAGINQTAQKLYLTVSVNVTTLTPLGTETINVSTDVIVAETIIVGTVPDSYVNIGADALSTKNED